MARRPAFAEPLTAFGFPPDGYPTWGVDFVRAGGGFYQPDPEGVAAVIAPVFEAGTLIDLVACHFATREVRTRRGDARLLGFSWLENHYIPDEPLRVFDCPLTWIRGRGQGVVVIDWTSAARLLRDVHSIVCQSRATAGRLIEAFEWPAPYPPVHHVQGARQ